MPENILVSLHILHLKFFKTHALLLSRNSPKWISFLNGKSDVVLPEVDAL